MKIILFLVMTLIVQPVFSSHDIYKFGTEEITNHNLENYAQKFKSSQLMNWVNRQGLNYQYVSSGVAKEWGWDTIMDNKGILRKLTYFMRTDPRDRFRIGEVKTSRIIEVTNFEFAENYIFRFYTLDGIKYVESILTDSNLNKSEPSMAVKCEDQNLTIDQFFNKVPKLSFAHSDISFLERKLIREDINSMELYLGFNKLSDSEILIYYKSMVFCKTVGIDADYKPENITRKIKFLGTLGEFSGVPREYIILRYTKDELLIADSDNRGFQYSSFREPNEKELYSIKTYIPWLKEYIYTPLETWTNEHQISYASNLRLLYEGPIRYWTDNKYTYILRLRIEEMGYGGY